MLFSVQSNDRVRQTWSGPDLGAMLDLMKNHEPKAGRPQTAAASVVKFTPTGDSGVTRALADALGRTSQERTALADAFSQIKQGYEAEVAKEGKSNNLAAAMTFFIVANVVAYHQTEMPSDADSVKLFQSLQQMMSRVPAFAAMSNAEKHRMHDWLVCMAGFAATNYMDAKQNGDAQALATIKEFADYSMRLVLGVEAGKLSLSGANLNVQASPAAAASVDKSLIGTWTAASKTSSVGSLAPNFGSMRLRYIFNADGTYSFKGERMFSSQRWWTTEESGTFSVNGDSLTITPRVSKATLRNLNGIVQETRANALEKVTYKWTTHYFEGIGETNLVLEPPQATNRDGILGSNSLFPRAYLYSPGDRLEWRF
jgi:hypothetical protein